jgi:hypothetical protein
MSNHLVDFLRDHGPLLIRIAGLMIAALVTPLIGLAWWKRIDPPTPLLMLLAAPCALAFALLVNASLLPVILMIDRVIPLIGLVTVTSNG